MKKGTVYALRVKKAYAKLRAASPKPDLPEPDDPLHRLAIAMIGVRVGDARAEAMIEHLLSGMADWNEVRVSSVYEIQEAANTHSADLRKQYEKLANVLQVVFDRENAMSLGCLREIGLREARQYLEDLPGVDPYVVASVILWSLGGHGIPVDDSLLGALRDADLVHPDADRGEVQAFLERHVAASDAREFCIRMQLFPQAHAQARRKGKRPVKKTAKKAKRRKRTGT